MIDDNEVMLMIEGSRKYLLSRDEAMQIASVLNTARRVEQTWMKDIPSETSHVIKNPLVNSTYVVPIPITLKLEIQSNMKMMEKNT